MATFPFMQVDAFTDQALAGNPCAVLLDADSLDSAEMLAIARENNLSETAFVRRSDVADFGVRYFTTTEELPLAGHPTIATIYALWKWGRLHLTGDTTHIHLELKVGPIPIEISAESGQIRQIIMTQKKPVFMATYDPEVVLPAFGLTTVDGLPGVPIQTVSTGTPQLMIPLRSHEALRRAQLNGSLYEALKAAGDFYSPHLFSLGGATPTGQTFARHLGHTPDIAEDPVTGSATGGMGAYLWRYGLIAEPTFIAEQGHWMQRPGTVHVEIVGARNAIDAVKVGGAAVLVIEGTFTTPSA